MVGIPIITKKWSPLFSSKKEKIECDPIWVRLSCFPIQYWNESRFAAIRNWIGKYIEANMSFQKMRMISMARILVTLDLRKGLAEDLEIETLDK